MNNNPAIISATMLILLFFSAFVLINIIKSKTKRIFKLLCTLFLLIHCAISFMLFYELLESGIEFITNLNPQVFNLKCGDLNLTNCKKNTNCYIGNCCGPYCTNTPPNPNHHCFCDGPLIEYNLNPTVILHFILYSLHFALFMTIYLKNKMTVSKLKNIVDWLIILLLSYPIIWGILLYLRLPFKGLFSDKM